MSVSMPRIVTIEITKEPTDNAMVSTTDEFKTLTRVPRTYMDITIAAIADTVFFAFRLRPTFDVRRGEPISL